MKPTCLPGLVFLATATALGGPSVLRAAPLPQQEALGGHDRLLEPEMEEVYRVGALSGPDWQLLGDVIEVAFDGEGRLYVVDPQARRVVVVAPDGTFEGTLGRSGEGPGEFQLPSGVAYTGSGAIAVGDQRARRVTRFQPSGELIATEPVVGPRPLFSTLVTDPRGGVAYRPPSESWGDTSVPIYRMPLDGSGTVEVVYQARNPGGATMRQAQGASAGGWGATRVPPPTFTPDIHVQPMGEALAIVDGGDYRITLIGADGRRVITRPVAPREVTSRDREAARELRRMELQEASGSSAGGVPIREMSKAEIQESLDAMTFTETLPVISDLRGRAGGVLLVARHGPVAPGPGPVDIIDADGEYAGTVPELTLPDALGPDGLAAWIEEGDLGVTQVVVRRIRF